MPMNNLIVKHFSDAEKQQMFDLLNQMNQLVDGKLVQLNAEERKRYGSINEDNKKVVNKVKDYYSIDPTNCAPEVDWTEFLADYADREFLGNFLMRMDALTYDMYSTKMLHDYDNAKDALADYSYAKYRAERGITGAIGKVNELKQFFPRTGTATSTEAADDTPVE